ncbi:MAG: flagellar basal body L-ring protein FlgH [Bacillota bacterium]
MNYRILITLLIITLLVLPVQADNSLWSEDGANMYSDQPDYEVGDIITIEIKEDASSIQSADTSTEQDFESETDDGSGLLGFLKSFGFSYSDSGSADGETSRSGTLEANITTEVAEIKENGNLMIEGNKDILINDEKQTIKLSGTIRPDDINLDNTIQSKNVAQANIEYEGQGPVGDKQKPGLLERFFNWIF